MRTSVVLTALATAAAMAHPIADLSDTGGAGTFLAWWAALAGGLLLFAKAALLSTDALATRLRRTGRDTVMRTRRPVPEIAFWASMAICAVVWRFALDIAAAQQGAEHYAIGPGALVEYGVEILAAATCFAFCLVEWRPVRWALAAVAVCTAIGACSSLM
jgi:hypothetical protein